MDWKSPRIEVDHQNDPDFKPRQNARLDVSGLSRIKGQERYHVEVKVRDLSPCGFMAECAAPVSIGSFVTLDIPGIGQVDAQVRWQLASRMGGMFKDPITLSQCEWVAEKAGADDA